MSERYREWVRTTVEHPTEAQIRAFAAWLSDDHSWYKHLPLHGPGEPFIVFLAPHVHQVFVERADGPGGWRSFVDNPQPTWNGDRLTLDLRPGDDPPDLWGPPTQIAGGMSTQDVWTRMSRFSYFNFGRPGQPASEAIATARASLRVQGDDGQPTAVPDPGLWRGLVYLRGTVSPVLGPMEEEYETLRSEHGLPSHAETRREQLQAIIDAASAIVGWVYDQKE